MLELTIKLRGQGLVVGKHQHRTVELSDGVGNGEGLAAAGYSQQHLKAFIFPDSSHQGSYGFRLVAAGLIIGVEFENSHDTSALVCLAFLPSSFDCLDLRRVFFQF